jgi:hypothetical protein
MEEPPFQLTEFVKRPGVGHVGKLIRVRTNFFEVITMPDMDILHYDVTITPEVPQQLNRKVFERFSEQNRTGALGGVKPVFDGTCSNNKKKKNIICRYKISQY